LQESNTKYLCLKSCLQGFEVKTYLAQRAKATLEEPVSKRPQKKADEADTSIGNADLYEILKAWRNEKAEELNVPVYRILQLKSMRIMSKTIPSTKKALLAVKGIGRSKLDEFGIELLGILNNFREESNLEVLPDEEPELPKKKNRTPTRDITYELWKSGKSIHEIAEERGFAISTIEGHLSYFVGAGELSVFDFISAEKVDIITTWHKKHGPAFVGEMKMALGDQVTYGDLRFVMMHLSASDQKE